MVATALLADAVKVESGSAGCARIAIADRSVSRGQDCAQLLEGVGHVQVFQSASACLAAVSELDLVIVASDISKSGCGAVVRDIGEAVGGGFVPVVVVGPDDDPLRHQAFLAGCADYIRRNAPADEFEARVRVHLSNRNRYIALEDANARLLRAGDNERVLASLVVHDLRSPLTALRGNVELLVRGVVSDRAEVDRALGDCLELVDRSLSRVAGLLDVQGLEEGVLIARTARVKIAPFLDQVSRHHRVPIMTRGLTLEVRCNADLEGVFDAELVGRVIENLLDNSVRYARREGVVAIRVAQEAGVLEFRVGNDGASIPVDQRACLFERYFRIEERRLGQRENRGLGLYFCYLVAHAHGGDIRVDETEELPTEFVLRLPQSSLGLDDGGE